MTNIDPSLGRVPRVLVPVELDAMVLRADTGGFADCRMHEPDPVGGRQQLLPPPFADQQTVRPKGLYLHWALPDALTHQRPPSPTTASVPLPLSTMPAIPDRWLVVRFALGVTPEHRAATGWVIEASGAQPTATPLDRWVESGVLPTPGQEPTALGFGDLAWAAYYDNVANRLGFYDPLDQGTKGPLGYLVCGWYADPRLDPLADSAITSLSDFYRRMGELGWALPMSELEQDVLAAPTLAPRHQPGDLLAQTVTVGGRPPLITDGSWWPRGSLFHGSVVGIGWPDPGWPDAEEGLLGSSAGGPPKPEETAVAFGTTVNDALSALMVGFLAAAQGVGQDSILSEDRMLEAFQLGLLGEIDHPDGRARLDAQLHADGFHAVTGGQMADQVTPPMSMAPPMPLVPGDEPVTTGRLRAWASGGSLATDLSTIGRGRLEDVLPTMAPTSTPGPVTPQPVQRSLPRWFGAGEPAVVVQGLRRSLKHGGDNRFSQDGTLMCRLSGFTVYSLSARIGQGNQRSTVGPDQLLESPFSHPSLPADCADLVRETVLLDPASARSAALLTAPPTADNTTTVDELTRNFMVEQTVWWALRDPLVNANAILYNSGIAGTLPSPLAFTPPSAAWAPRHLDWQVEIFRSPGGLADWSLGDLDFTLDNPSALNTTPGSGTLVSGRALLTGGVAQKAALAGQSAIELCTLAGTAGVSAGDGNVFVPAFAGGMLARLTDAAGGGDGLGSGGQTIAQAFVAALRNMDVMATTLEGIHATLRGEPTGQFVGTGEPPPPAPNPDAVGIVAGLMRPVRFRLVDTFGQVVDLLGSGPGRPADATQAHTARAAAVPGHPDLVALAPRFTAPGRLLLRFVDATAKPNPPPLEQVGESARPVCGFVLPDHLDGALEFFDAAGNALGCVRPALDGTGRAVWENAPGTTTGAGQRPSAMIPDPSLGAIADGLVRWSAHDGLPSTAEGALGALLRLIDSTMWSVDPFGHAGDEHVSLLVGHPIVVLRASLRLDVDDPLGASDIKTSPVNVRLGALPHWQDGLLAFFAKDDASTVYPAAAAATTLARPFGPGQGYLGPISQIAAFHSAITSDLAPGQVPRTPITHPYVAPDATIRAWPGHAIPLTLLVSPHCYVHVTSGLLPRKELGVRRQWLADPLARLAPTFRFGPVLVDPKTIRMPVATELAGSWSWNHRIKVTEWSDQPVANATGDALMTATQAKPEEGWLTLHPTDAGTVT